MTNYLGQNKVTTEELTVGIPPTAYSFPTQKGTNGEILITDVNGDLVFGTGGGGDHTLLTNIGVTTHASLDAFKSDIENKINQDVKTTASPDFATINTDTVSNAAGFRVVDKPIANVSHIHSGADPITYSGYNIRCGVGSTRINHGSDNTASYLECKQEEQLFKVAGFDKLNVTTSGVTFNPNGTSSYTMPQNRGTSGEGLVSDGSGGVNWASSVGSTETMAESFSAAVTQADNIITTQPTSAKSTLFIRQGIGAPSTVFEAQKEGGGITVRIDSDGIKALSSSVNKAIVGVEGQTYTLPTKRAVSSNQLPVSTGTDGVVEWQPRSYANIYFKDNNTITPTPTQNVYTIIRGARLGTFASDFTLNPGPTDSQALVYRGPQPKLFQITQSVSWESAKRETFAQCIFKDGVVLPGSEMSSELNSNDNNATTVVIVQLEDGEGVAGFVKCVTDNTGCVIKSYQLSVTEV
jgi:hypothetical protein